MPLGEQAFFPSVLPLRTLASASSALDSAYILDPLLLLSSHPNLANLIRSSFTEAPTCRPTSQNLPAPQKRAAPINCFSYWTRRHHVRLRVLPPLSLTGSALEIKKFTPTTARASPLPHRQASSPAASPAARARPPPPRPRNEIGTTST